MVERKYEKHIIQELKDPKDAKAAAKYAEFATRILWLDEDLMPGAFQVNCSWYREPCLHVPNPHMHGNDEVLGFFGGDPNNPTDLCAEIEFGIENEIFTLTRSTLIFAPAGIRHCPLNIKRVDRPLFHVTINMSGKYVVEHTDRKEQVAQETYGKYVLNELKMPAGRTLSEAYKQRATKVLWMDGENTPGAFNVNVTWLWKATDFNHDEAHKHDYDEVIGFLGSDSTRPNDLNAEVEFWLEDEQYILNKSTLLWIPQGLTHCPLRVLNVDQPIFHFTTVRSGLYKQNLISEGN